MQYFKRKDGSVFGKVNPSKEQLDSYKKDGCVACDESGKPLKSTVPISPQITSATNQNVGLSLPANFASLSTADKLKTLNDLGIRIG